MINFTYIDEQLKESKIFKNPIVKAEREYLSRCKKISNLIIAYNEKSLSMGFDLLLNFKDNEDRENNNSISKTTTPRSFLINRLKMIFPVALKYGPKLFRGLRKCYKDVELYLKDLEMNGKYTEFSNFGSNDLLKSYPNEDLWEELNNYSKEKWDIAKIGFTELPNSLIFKNRYVLFKHVLIFMQEMRKERIDKAPGKKAAFETMRVYATLGLAVANIADWLRKKGIRAQAIHPLGGLVCTPPLAGKAGMGGQGKQGLLITPELGPRQRLALILIQNKIFEYTDNKEHDWIEKYCDSCKACQNNCPVDAIMDQKLISIENIPGIGPIRTCIEKEKCFPYFQKTLGCSICIKVCPFSSMDNFYERVKEKYQ
ncbi:MAG: hypothetical protein ACTSRH_07285 [Promethearchaeota archaeon]